ncbi:LacI family DNA-binding transcriptional regulator [Microbacterium marinilacus]|uniref:LacI family DNA-binding transcriptional regulator n=1 Tax=Microbacterium marinilacus TaxID=415209 RepID=A0ABP7BS66_9MICO|nr:LacI family DNA-binding transcriptional regulator [Microbacterium marinilacus]MBY0689133.1 LacI family transcriptional regulator [Microbacterium marinilacus]
MSRATHDRSGRPTIEDVARLAGVSRAATSRALNGQPGASAEVRERVARAVAELGYRPDLAARELASGRRRTIDLVVVLPDDCETTWLAADPYYGRIIAGLMPALDREGLPLRIRRIDETDAAAQLRELAPAVTAGAVIVNVPVSLAERFARQARGPVVSLTPTDPRVPGVLARNREGARAAVEHLHALGRHRIGAVHGPAGNECALARRTGHLEAAAALGLDVVTADGDFGLQGGRRAAAELLARHPDLDALFVASDMMGAGAVQAVTAAGRRVPEDVAVVGFDDSIAAVYANPPLTTIRQPVEEMASAAVEALLDGTAGPGWRPAFACGLVVRASTAS